MYQMTACVDTVHNKAQILHADIKLENFICFFKAGADEDGSNMTSPS